MRTVLLLAALVAAGCGGGDPAPTTTAAAGGTGDERRYVAAVGEWTSVVEGVEGDCAAQLVELAGEPPSPRMRELERQAVAVCVAYQEGDAEGALEGTQTLLERLYALEYRLGESRPLPVKGGKTTESRIEPRFGEVASKLVGKPTEVRCWSRRDWDAAAAQGSPYGEDEGASTLAGFASFDDTRVHLSPGVCEPLVRLAYGDRGRAPDRDVAFAVVALAHESRHRAGVELESETECWGMQDARRATRLLGAPRGYADALAELYWEELYPLHEPPYFDPECKDGGRLDLRPDSPVWP